MLGAIFSDAKGQTDFAWIVGVVGKLAALTNEERRMGRGKLAVGTENERVLGGREVGPKQHERRAREIRSQARGVDSCMDYWAIWGACWDDASRGFNLNDCDSDGIVMRLR